MKVAYKICEFMVDCQPNYCIEILVVLFNCDEECDLINVSPEDYSV